MRLANQRSGTGPAPTDSDTIGYPHAGQGGGKLYIKGSDLLLPDEPRLSVLWRAKRTITMCAIIAALVAAGLATLPQTRYSAQATVRISLLSAKGVPRENVLAQNDLAAQYALLATSAPVLAAAEVLAGEPLGEVEATPIDGYNIVGITAVAESPKSAASRADSVAQALVTYVKSADAEAAAAAAKVIEPQLKQLDKQIRDAQDAVTNLQGQLIRSGKDGSAALQALLNSQLSLLGTLVANRSNIFTSATRDAAAAAPQLTLLDRPNEGEALPKHALIYALVSFLIAAVAAAEIAVLMFRLRTLRQITPGPRGNEPKRRQPQPTNTGYHAQRRAETSDGSSPMPYDTSGRP